METGRRKCGGEERSGRCCVCCCVWGRDSTAKAPWVPPHLGALRLIALELGWFLISFFRDWFAHQCFRFSAPGCKFPSWCGRNHATCESIEVRVRLIRSKLWCGSGDPETRMQNIRTYVLWAWRRGSMLAISGFLSGLQSAKQLEQCAQTGTCDNAVLSCVELAPDSVRAALCSFHVRCSNLRVLRYKGLPFSTQPFKLVYNVVGKAATRQYVPGDAVHGSGSDLLNSHTI